MLRHEAVLQVLAPLSCFLQRERSEELGGRFRSTQLGHHVQDQRGLQQLRLAAVHLHDRALRKVQRSLPYKQIRQLTYLAEVRSDLRPVVAGGKPRFPPDCLGVVGRQRLGAAGHSESNVATRTERIASINDCLSSKRPPAPVRCSA